MSFVTDLYNPFPTKLWFFTCLQSFENTMERGEIARTEQFLLFPQCFLPILETFLTTDLYRKSSDCERTGGISYIMRD